MKKTLLWAAVLAVLLLLAGCAAADDPTDHSADNPPQNNTEVPPAEDNTLLQAFSLPYYQQDTLDPLTCPDGAHQAIGALLYEGLYALDRRFEPQPVLAESYRYDPQAYLYTIRVRSGVTFSDGTPLTAVDVAASLLRARSTARYSGRLQEVVSITSADNVVYVTLSRPNAAFIARLDIPIVKAGTENDLIPVGTGRYLWEQDETGARLVVNGHYWKRQSLPIRQIPLVPCKDADAAAYAFLSREVQLIAYDVTGTGAIRVSGRSTYTDAPTSIMQYVGFNTNSPLFSSPALRAAVARGIDRNDCVNACLLGHGMAAAFPISPASPFYPANVALSYSSEAYEQALEEAGYGAEAEVREVVMLVSSENAFRVQAAQRIADGLSRGALRVTVKSLPWTDFRAALATGSYDLYYGECKLTADWDLFPLLAPGGSLNFSGFTDEALPELLEKAATAGTAGRAAPLRELYAWLQEAAPFVPVCFKNVSVLLPDKAVDAISPTAADPFYDLADWTIHWAADKK